MKIAEDIVEHFMEHGQMGKVMVISIDKATAVRMYDKVRKCTLPNNLATLPFVSARGMRV